MKIPVWLSTTYSTLTATIGCGLVGLILAFSVYGNVFPFWHRSTIQFDQGKLIDILFVKSANFTDETQNDTVYIKIDSGDVYSILHNQSKSLPSLPDGEVITKIRLRDGGISSPIVAMTEDDNAFQLIGDEWESIQGYKEFYFGSQLGQCANVWRQSPPVGIGMIDSEGMVFEHALANMSKCYVLYNNGKIVAWSRTTDAFSLMTTLGFGIVIGLISGGFLSWFLWRRRKT